MLVTSKEILEQANNANYAIPAANFIDLSMIKNYIAVAEKLNKPLILQYAEGCKPFMPLDEAAFLGRQYAAQASVPVVLHLDHGLTIPFIKEAVDLGFTSVMIDASSEKFEDNVKHTKEILEYAHARGVVVEAEIGHVGQGANYENYDHSDSIYTEVEAAKKFAELTGVDSLAVSIGTAHGKYKGIPKLNFERLTELKQALTVPLVLHGGSGSGDENLKKCCELGIAKVNIFTDLMVAGYEGFAASKAQDYLGFLNDSHKAVQEKLEQFYHIFNN